MDAQGSGQRPPADAGVTLVEVVVALLVFAVIAVGIVSATGMIIKLTAENESREVAANLAAQDMDAVRAVPTSTTVSSATIVPPAIGGRTYTITRTVTAPAATSAAGSCETATASLPPVYVTVTVTWTGQLATTPAVRSDTQLAPRSVTTTTTGAISVLATNVYNNPAPGVAVTITPTSGGAALTQAVAATDSTGCSLASLVTPGTYQVTLSRPGYLSPGQTPTAIIPGVVVVAGKTTPVTGTYDNAASYSVGYSPSSAVLPTNLLTSFLPYSQSSSITCASAATTPVSLFPSPAGYSAIAGTTGTSYASPACGAVVGGPRTCLSADPTQWPVSALLGSPRGATSAAPAGGSGSVTARVGTVTIAATAAAYLTAVPATDPLAATDGNPGCNLSTPLTFDKVLKNGAVTVGLPFGSWKLYSGATAGATTSQLTALNGLSISSPNLINSALLGSVVTLDPRLSLP